MSPGGISLPSTPIVTFGSFSPPKTRYTVTPLWLPSVTPASIPLSVKKFGSRANPLQPPGVTRRTVSLETMAAHHYNQQRAIAMQQKEYCRYHQDWQRPCYGSVTEKEEYRQEMRQLLKKQMSEKWARERQMLTHHMKDAEAAREADRLALLQDLQRKRAKALVLQRFRDENKKLMETKWKENRLIKSLEIIKERELLQYNPINWSGTLK